MSPGETECGCHLLREWLLKPKPENMWTVFSVTVSSESFQAVAHEDGYEFSFESVGVGSGDDLKSCSVDTDRLIGVLPCGLERTARRGAFGILGTGESVDEEDTELGPLRPSGLGQLVEELGSRGRQEAAQSHRAQLTNDPDAVTGELEA